MAAGDRKSFFAERCHFFIRSVFWPKILGLAQGWARNAAHLRTNISVEMWRGGDSAGAFRAYPQTLRVRNSGPGPKKAASDLTRAHGGPVGPRDSPRFPHVRRSFFCGIAIPAPESIGKAVRLGRPVGNRRPSRPTTASR